MCVRKIYKKQNGEAKVSLKASKYRIAPMKNVQSLPHLELKVNLILCRLVVVIVEGLRGDTTFDTISCLYGNMFSVDLFTRTKN